MTARSRQSSSGARRLTVVVGSGGVGKTTLAAALGAATASLGENALVMTFDPSRRLRQAVGLESLGVGENEAEIAWTGKAPGRLVASVLDARETFDGLVERYAPDDASRRRVLDNPFYRHLAGSLTGILEYMAVERLYEVARESRFDRVILDTPPTQQALDFLDAPDRIVSFLDSGAVRLGTRAWFDREGKFRPTQKLGRLGERFEEYLDSVIGLDLLREMVAFFQAFEPLYGGFRERAAEVKRLLESEETGFLLVTSPEPDRVADTMFFARRLVERGYRLDGVVANRVQGAARSGQGSASASESRRLLEWLHARDQLGVRNLGELLGESTRLLTVPAQTDPSGDLDRLAEIGLPLRPES